MPFQIRVPLILTHGHPCKGPFDQGPLVRISWSGFLRPNQGELLEGIRTSIQLMPFKATLTILFGRRGPPGLC